MGTLAVTIHGKSCQRWDSQTPHSHDRKNTDKFPDASLSDAANYCRNPDNEPNGPWCYTTHPYTRWQHCDVQFCENGRMNIIHVKY